MGDDDPAGAAARIKAENPKYVLREWMLVEAYTAAKVGGDAKLNIVSFDPFAT